MAEITGERAKVLYITPDLLKRMMTQGWSVGADEEVRCVHVLPKTALFARGWYDAQLNVFVMLFLCPEWEIVTDGAEYPVIMPKFQRVSHD